MIEVFRAKCPDFAALEGIGVAGHMHGATLLDAQDSVLRPSLLWNDTRSHVQAARLDADPAIRQISGNIVFSVLPLQSSNGCASTNLRCTSIPPKCFCLLPFSRII